MPAATEAGGHLDPAELVAVRVAFVLVVERMARPVGKRPLRAALDQSAPTYPVTGQDPGQDGGSHVPILINLAASMRHFHQQDFGTPFDCQAISLTPPADVIGRSHRIAVRGQSLGYP